MSLFKKRFFDGDLGVTWKMALMNGIVIGVFIWLVGVSVKDYACMLVEQHDLLGSDQQLAFNQTMQNYLQRAIWFAILVALAVYVFMMRIILIPIQNYRKRTEESRQQMLSNISHDLRTPLSNLHGYLEGLHSGMIEGSPELYRSLYEESRHLRRLVDQLQELTLWEDRREEKQADHTVVDMDLVVQSVLKLFELELQTRKIECDVGLEPGQVRGDEGGLRQVVTNLLDNAIRYDRGGYIKLEGKRNPRFYQLTITNKGQPITDDQLERIFERFYRVDPSRHRHTGGTGLGLAIAQEIVEQHGGKIWLISTGNQHSFTFTIPVHDRFRFWNGRVKDLAGFGLLRSHL